MVSNSDLEKIIVDSIKPEVTFMYYGSNPPQPAGIDNRFIEVLKKSDEIVSILLNPKYQEFIRLEDSSELSEEKQTRYSGFAELLDAFQKKYSSYNLFKDTNYPDVE